jgi:hypothetical protein
MADLQKVVTRMAREIQADIESGDVPTTVRTFGDLHAYVDGNAYGGFCEDAFADALIEEFGGRDDDEGLPEDFVRFMNAAQDTIGAWLDNGRGELRVPEWAPVAKVKRESEWVLVNVEEAALTRGAGAWSAQDAAWVRPDAATRFTYDELQSLRAMSLTIALGGSDHGKSLNPFARAGTVWLSPWSARVVCDAMCDAGDFEDRDERHPLAEFNRAAWLEEARSGHTVASYFDWLKGNLDRVADDLLGATPDGKRVFLEAKNAAVGSGTESDEGGAPAPGM